MEKDGTTPTRHGRPWSDEEDEKLANSVKINADVSEVAKLMGRSANAVRKRLRHLKSDSDKQTKEEEPTPQKPTAQSKFVLWGAIGTLITILIFLNSLRPNLVLGAVRNPDARFESEARIEIKNNGTWDLVDLFRNKSDIHVKMEGTTITRGSSEYGGIDFAPKLSPGESIFVPIVPYTHMGMAGEVNECHYQLKVRFRQKILSVFTTWEMEKRWFITLRKPGNAASQWDVIPQ